MKKLVLTAIAATVLGASSGLAADLPRVLKAPPAAAAPSPWDWAFGGALMSDYNFRGISQSDRGPSATVYSETRFNATPNFQLYFGQQYYAVDLPTKTSCECDIYGGIRPTFGAFAFDFGAIYYWYPKEQQQFTDSTFSFVTSTLLPGGSILTLRDTDYWEVYGKVTWEVMKDRFAVGANVYYSPDWLNTGAAGLYASATAKLTLPAVRLNIGMFDEVGWYLSGEFGHYWLDTATNYAPFFTPFDLPDYSTWNAGIAFTWKVATFDIRYYDTDLSKQECFILTSDPRGVPSGQSKWCNSAIVGALKFDLTAMTNLK